MPKHTNPQRDMLEHPIFALHRLSHPPILGRCPCRAGSSSNSRSWSRKRVPALGRRGLEPAHEVFDIAHDCALKKGRFEAGNSPDRIEVGVRQIRTLASRSGLCAFLHAQRTWPPFPSARFGIGFNAKKPINASASASICSILACWRDNQREHSQPAPSPGDPPRWRQRLETRSRGRLYRSFPRRFHVNLA